MMATVGRPRLVASDQTALVYTTYTVILGSGAPIGSARTTTPNRRSRIPTGLRRALRASHVGAHSITLPLHCGVRPATAARPSRVTARNLVDRIDRSLTLSTAFDRHDVFEIGVTIGF